MQTEQLWNLAEICARRHLADDVVVRATADATWSTTVGELRTLGDDVIARASHAPTFGAAEEILRAAFELHAAAAASFPAPNGYAGPIAAMRAASAMPASDFEARWKADRFAALAAEPERVAALRAAHGIPEPRFVVLADEDRFPAPNPYAAGIKALRERAAKENGR
jgi:hypothetical protein